MSEPRNVEDRIDWFLTHDPSGPGMCAQHTWHALGGDYGNPPAWGCADANECVDKVKASGRYWTPQTHPGYPPRGAWVGYRYGANGHACLSLGDGSIATTDPANGEPTGIEDLSYPNRWGANGWTLFTDQYAGVRFDIGGDDPMGDHYEYDYLEKPGGTQSIGTSYEELEQSAYDPANSGWETTYVYSNLPPTSWRDGHDIGCIRVRIIRADGDETGHDDWVIAKQALDENGRTLRHLLYWEAGDGKPTHVELKCEGGLLGATLHTRYTKKAIVLK